MYQIHTSFEGQLFACITTNRSFIPFAPDNTDYQRFKTDIQNGTELLDANASPVTGDALTTFIGTLP